MTPKPRRRWWRRLWRLALVAVAARLLLAVLLAPLLSFAAGFAGLDVTMRSASLSLHGMWLRLEDVVALDAERPLEPPLLVAQEIVLDVSSVLLLRGELGIVDAALSGARISLTRTADGSLRLPSSWASSPVATAPPPATADEPAPASFALPLHIASARLHDCRLHVTDDVAPEHPIDITLDVDLTDVGRLDRPGTIVVRAQSPRWLDRFTLQAELLATSDRLRATWEGHVRGVPPTSLPMPRAFAAALHDTRFLALAVGGELTGEIPAGSGQRRLAGRVQLDLTGDHNDPLHLDARLGPTSGADDEAVTPFEVEFAAAGLVGQLRLTDGEVRQHGGTTSVRANFAAEEMRLPWLLPLLTEHGITLPGTGVSARAALAAEFGDSFTGSVLDLTVLGDGLEVALPQLEVRDVRAADGGLAIDRVVVRGPTVAVRSDADGALVIAGIRLGKPAAVAPGAAAAPPPPQPAATAPPSLPHLRLGSLQWTGGSFAFTDASLSPPATLRLDDLSVRGDALTLGAASPPGRLQASARLVDAIDSIQLDMTMRSSPTTLHTTAQLHANGITGAGASPWLQRLGMTPGMRAGSLQLQAETNVERTATGMQLAAKLHDVALRDGDEVLLSLDRAEGTQLQLGATTDLGPWQLDRPFLLARRLPDGSLQALGMRFAAAAPAAPPTLATADAPAARAAPAAAAAPTPPATAPTLGPLTLRDGRVAWHDNAATPLVLGLQATVDKIAADTPFPFELTVNLGDALAKARLTGQAMLGAAMGVELQLAAEGLRGAGMQRLLPPPLRCELADGRLQLRASLTQGASPATDRTLQLTGLQIHDGTTELVALDRCELRIAEATADHLHVANLAAAGLRGALTMTADGLRIAGFVLPPAPDDTAPAAALPTAAAGATGVRMPRLTVDAFAVACDRFVVLDARGGAGEPLVLTGSLTMDPWAAGPAVATAPPASLHLAASALPLCPELRIDVELDPFAMAPTAELRVRGVFDPSALPRVVPSLATTLAGTTSRATFAADLHARFDLRRRDPRWLDLARPFGAEVELSGVELRDEATQQPLMELQSIDVIARAIDLRRGDLLLRSIDVDTPVVAVTRTPKGTELLGFRLLPPAGDAPAAPPVPTATAPAAGAAPEFAIDRLDIAGLQLTVQDLTTVPPTLLPIAGCDIELLRFSTRALQEARPFAFAISMRGGNAPYTRRIVRSSMFAGILGSAVAATGLGGREHEIEERPLLDELQLSGHLQLHPFWKGQVRAEVTAFELPALRGIARSSGIEINDGVVDHSLTATLRGRDGIDVRSTTVFTWLSLSEPPGGPISTYLRLPAPLDTVLFLLRNETDEHRLPVQLHIPADGLSGGAIGDAVAEAFARMLASAVGGVAGRATGVFTGALGLTGGPLPTIQVPVPFAIGASAPDPAGLRAVVDALAGNDQLEVVLLSELGAADLERVTQLATPPRAVVAEQARRLSLHREQLLADRVPLAATVEALYGAGRMQEAQARQAELVARDEVLGDIERTIDVVLAMLVDDNPRAAKRRTQAAAKALGAARQAEVAAALRTALPGLAKERIVTRPPRAVPTAGLADGGQVVVTVRRRTTQ